MTAFILSSAIAFALYELLALTQWPPARTEFHFYQGTITLTEAAAAIVLKSIRTLIVVVILLLVLTIHNFTSSAGVLAKYEVNIVFGFVFGPLFAIWINSVVVHSAEEDLTRGQIFAAIALVLLFFLGAVGNETSGLIRQYARNLSSLKIAGTELSFTSNERNDRSRLNATGIAGTSATYVAGGSQGLQNVAALDVIVQRDRDYLTKVLAPKGTDVPAGDLERAGEFATASIAPPLSCLLSWFQQTGDSRPVDKYLTGYTDAFRQLEAINTQMNLPTTVDERKMQETRLNEITSDFVRNGLTMALDVALSTTQKDVLKACGKWFEVYCPPDNKPAADKPDSGVPLQQCLRSELKQFADPSVWPKTGKVGERIASLTTGLKEFVTPQGSVDTRGLEMLPYFAIGRASLMAQLGQHEAAAAILDGWLQRRAVENGLAEKQKAFTSNPILKIKDDWFALRVRAMLISYVEEWLGDKETNAASVVQTEHLENLRATRDGFKSRLLKADFFNELDKSCRPRCEPVFRRPAECNSDQPSERLALWRKLYSSYITMEYTYIHRALGHPDYQAKFAESVNDEARRLVNYDLSCGIDQPRPEVIYGQSLLGFVENALSYSRVRAGVDSEDAQIKRLDEAERAAKFGLEIVEAAAAEDQERTGKPYLERIAPSFAVQVQEQLKMQLKRIRQAQKNVAE